MFAGAREMGTADVQVRGAVGDRLSEHDVDEPDVETASDAYASRFAGPVGAWFLRIQADHVLDLLGRPTERPLLVLDVGGGHGQLTGPLVAAGHRVVVHGSRVSCHTRLCTEGAAVMHVASPLLALPFPDASFDLVVGIRLLAHVADWQGLCRELARVSRDRVLLDFPARSALHHLAPGLFGAKQRVEGNTRPYFDFEVAEVEAELARLGLCVLGVRRQFALPMALHRLLRAPGLSGVLESTAERLGVTRSAGSPVLVLAGHEVANSSHPCAPRVGPGAR